MPWLSTIASPDVGRHGSPASGMPHIKLTDPPVTPQGRRARRPPQGQRRGRGPRPSGGRPIEARRPEAQVEADGEHPADAVQAARFGIWRNGRAGQHQGLLLGRSPSPNGSRGDNRQARTTPRRPAAVSMAMSTALSAAAICRRLLGRADLEPNRRTSMNLIARPVGQGRRLKCISPRCCTTHTWPYASLPGLQPPAIHKPPPA